MRLCNDEGVNPVISISGKQVNHCWYEFLQGQYLKQKLQKDYDSPIYSAKITATCSGVVRKEQIHGMVPKWSGQ